MKKIFTLLFSLGAITSVFAQSGYKHNDSKQVVVVKSVSKDNHMNDYSFSAKDRDAQIQKINYEYAAKIKDVQRNRFMKTSEKNRQIRILELQRKNEIQKVKDRYENSRKYSANHHW